MSASIVSFNTFERCLQLATTTLQLTKLHVACPKLTHACTNSYCHFSFTLQAEKKGKKKRYATQTVWQHWLTVCFVAAAAAASSSERFNCNLMS